MLMVNNIEVVYSNVSLVLRGVTLQVADESIVALLGANGAGKTTTLKAISGLLHSEDGRVSDGTIEYGGVRIDRRTAEEIVRMGITQVMEGRVVFPHLTVIENLNVGAYTRVDREVNSDIDMVFRYFPVLAPLVRRQAGFLSGGEQQMLVVGRAMMTRPKIMLLDEPSLGLSPLMVDEIFKIIERFNKEQHVSVLLVEQNALVALQIAQYGYIMENGKTVLDATAEKLLENPDVKEFYLGLSEVGVKKSYRNVKHYKRRKRWLV